MSCFVEFYSDTHVRMLEDCIQETILEQNKLAAGSDRSGCFLFIAIIR